MSFLDRLKNLFGKRNDVKSIESMEHRFKSFEEQKTVTEQEPTLPIKQQKLSKPIALSQSGVTYTEEPSIMPEIEKDSYQLGLAAGYTGRSIKEIEASLVRIESQMLTKDWFGVKMEQVDRRIEDIERAMGIAKGPLPPAEQQKMAFFKPMPLTQRMEQLLKAIKEAREISFSDLAMKMNMDISDLRSLLSIMTKRTNEIERFRVHRTGWVRYVGKTNQSQSDSSDSNQLNQLNQ